MKIDLSSAIAAEMDKALNSEENKQMFSSSSMLEKLAFKRVSEQDQQTEVELDLEVKLNKTASKKCSQCTCEKDCTEGECSSKCDCKKDKETMDSKASRFVRTLVSLSDELDSAGFERLAAASIMLADRLVSEAKAKKSDKKSGEKSKSKSPEKTKASDKDKASGKGKKMDMKERMKKMREMNGKNKGSKKPSSSKPSSSKKSDTKKK